MNTDETGRHEHRPASTANKKTENKGNKKNRPRLGSGPTYSDSPSDNVNSSITSSPTDTLRASKNSAAKVIKKSTPIIAKIKKIKNNDFHIDYCNGWNGVLVGLRKLLQLQYRGNSNYADYSTPNSVFSLRLSGHNANGNNFSPENVNISVYVALFEYPHIPSRVEYTEFRISQSTFNENPKGVVFEIVSATEKALMGELFEMDKDIAEKTQHKPEVRDDSERD